MRAQADLGGSGFMWHPNAVGADMRPQRGLDVSSAGSVPEASGPVSWAGL